MEKHNRHHYFLVSFGVILFVSLLHLGTIFTWIGNIIQIIMPVLMGFLLALILNVPMRGIERIIDKMRKKKEKELNLKLKRGISFSLTVILLIGILVLVVIVVTPKFVTSIISIYELIMSKWNDILKLLEEVGIDSVLIQTWIEKIDLKNIIKALSENALNLFGGLFKIVGSTVSGIVSLGIGLVISIYVLLGKEKLGQNTKKFITAHFKEERAKFIFETSKLIDEKYTKFLSGQCVEACILGILMFIVLSILRVPYASMIAVITTFCAFVPYVGAFLSCFIGAFLVFLVNPSKVLIYVIAYLITQFVENQFIYPHVVGTSVGLNALWTILAVFIGGELFGLFGMIFFIPLFAVIVELVNQCTEKKLKDKEIKPMLQNKN